MRTEQRQQVSFDRVSILGRQLCSSTKTEKINDFCINANPQVIYSIHTHSSISSPGLVLLHLDVTKANLITFPMPLPRANLYTQVLRHNHHGLLKARKCITMDFHEEPLFPEICTWPA